MSHRTDRRKFPRTPMLSLAFLELDGKESVIPGIVVDVSLGGMKILTQMPVECDGDLAIVIEYEGKKRLSIPGRLMWQQKMEVLRQFSFGIEHINGVEFKLPPEEIREIVFEELL
ncbi:MAG: PilZ domain-containing protein [Candidatus Eremiobacteraeota bacterium]|nr:PilZ domain-containing protein [Candidatus Eremiobacteraeota bacterium]